MGFIHSRNVCLKEVITFIRLWEEEEARLILREEKMGATENQALTIERRSLKAMRNMKDSILKEPLIHLENLDKKWCCYEWRRWWRWKKESTHETNKDKYLIVISWYCFVMHLFIFSWCVMHDRMFALMTYTTNMHMMGK